MGAEPPFIILSGALRPQASSSSLRGGGSRPTIASGGPPIPLSSLPPVPGSSRSFETPHFRARIAPLLAPPPPPASGLNKGETSQLSLKLSTSYSSSCSTKKINGGVASTSIHGGKRLLLGLPLPQPDGNAARPRMDEIGEGPRPASAAAAVRPTSAARPASASARAKRYPILPLPVGISMALYVERAATALSMPPFAFSEPPPPNVHNIRRGNRSTIERLNFDSACSHNGFCLPSPKLAHAFYHVGAKQPIKSRRAAEAEAAVASHVGVGDLNLHELSP